MIFFIISFAGGSSPSLKGKCPGTPFDGFPDTPVPLTTQQQRVYMCKGVFHDDRHGRCVVPGFGLRETRHKHITPWCKSPWRCARNYHLISRLTSTLTLHFITCKVSESQWLRLPVHRVRFQFTKPTCPIIYTRPISLPFNLLSVDSWCWCGISARGWPMTHRNVQEARRAI